MSPAPAKSTERNTKKSAIPIRRTEIEDFNSLLSKDEWGEINRYG